MKVVVILLLAALHFNATAQYTGGIGNGSISINAIALSFISPGMYVGGPSDGSTSITSNVLPLNAPGNLFSGGVGDGSNALTSPGLSLAASSMFIGGSNDGTGFVNSPALALAATSMYAGGTADGFSFATAPSTALATIGNYSGGPDDGSAFALASNTALNGTSNYSGGAGSGFNGIRNNNTSIATSSMYAGTGGDGFASALASAILIVPLPITWLDFTASRNQKDALLTWAVANEEGTDAYEVERSFDAASFITIGKVAAQRSVRTTANYSFVDDDPAAKCLNGNCLQVFYRIKQLGIDGRSTYSAVRRLPLDAASMFATIYPNPTSDKIVIHWNATGGKDIPYEVTLYNTTGVSILKSSAHTSTANSIDIQVIPSGIYYLRLSISGANYSYQITIIH